MQSTHADSTVVNQVNHSHASPRNNTSSFEAELSSTTIVHQRRIRSSMEKPKKRARTENHDIISDNENVKRALAAFPAEPTAVARRNERERNRVRLVNEGFNCLRQRIPFIPEKKKLSKVETLRYAVAYIKHLQCVIQEHDAKILGHAIERRRIKCGVVQMVSTRAQERWNEWMED